MNKLIKQYFFKTPGSLWLLFGSTVLAWLIICAWVLKSTGLWFSETSNRGKGSAASPVSQQRAKQNSPTAEADVAKLIMLKADAPLGQIDLKQEAVAHDKKESEARSEVASLDVLVENDAGTNFGLASVDVADDKIVETKIDVASVAVPREEDLDANIGVASVVVLREEDLAAVIDSAADAAGSIVVLSDEDLAAGIVGATDAAGSAKEDESVVISVNVADFLELDRKEGLLNDAEATRNYSAALTDIEIDASSISDKPESGSSVDGFTSDVDVLENVNRAAEELPIVEGSPEPQPTLLSYEQLRQQELEVLSVFSEQIEFNPSSGRVNQRMQRVLDRMFDPLYLYSEVPVIVAVASNESTGSATNNLLSGDRGQAIVTYLINRGLEVDRFSVYIEAADGLPFGEHRVRVLPEGLNR